MFSTDQNYRVKELWSWIFSGKWHNSKNGKPIFYRDNVSENNWNVTWLANSL